MTDIVAIGEAMLEFNQTEPGQPNYLQGFGGDTSNAIIAAARAGASTAYLTRLGNDAFGERLIDLWRQEGVQTDGIDIDPHRPTGIYFVTHGRNGHEFTYRRAGSAASYLTDAWLTTFAKKQIEVSKWLHVSGISLAISTDAASTVLNAMRLARASHVQVSFDSNLRLKLWSLEQAKQTIVDAIRLCDLFLPSMDDLTTLTGLSDAHQILDWCHLQGAQTVVLKQGDKGCIISKAGIRKHIQGRQVVAIDATGAGDCFCGNLLARLSLGDTLEDAADYANTAASIAVQGWGAVAALPHAIAVQTCRLAGQ